MKKKILLIIIGIIMLVPVMVKAQDLDSSIVLYDGLYGDSVKLLQTKLNEVSYCGLEVDGMFGPLTDDCVRRFQKTYNLEVDGIVGYKTITMLNYLTRESEVKSSNTVSNRYIPQYVAINANNLNVRKDAGTNNSIITKVKRGNVYAVYGSKVVNGVYWYRISVNNRYGYISSRFVEDNFILVDISDNKLSYYDKGKFIMNINVSTSNKTKTGYYIFSMSNNKSNLDNLVNISSSDINILSKYINNGTKIVVRD